MSDLNAAVHLDYSFASVGVVAAPDTGAPAADVACGGAQAIAKAKCAVAEYLRDLGLRDPDVVAQACQRIVSQAQRDLPANRLLDETALCEAAIRLTVKQLERWCLALAAQSGCTDEPERFGSVIAARLPALLERFPQALNQNRLPAELVGSLHAGLTPVVPSPRLHHMRQQGLPLVPPSWKRLVSQLRHRLFGRTPPSPNVEQKPTITEQR